MNIKHKLSTARSIVGRHGLNGLIAYILRIVFWRGRDDNSCRIFLFELSIPRSIPPTVSDVTRHTFRFATKEDIQTYHADPTVEIGDREVSAFERGDRCLLQFDGDTLVGFAWISSSNLIEIMWGFHFNMPDDMVYNYHSYTAPAYRGKGSQALRHLKLLEHVKETGQHRLLGWVDQMNLNSLRGVRKSGYKKIGVLRCVRRQETVQFSLKVSRDRWKIDQRP